MLPWVRRARAAGYAVVILDPNAGMDDPIEPDPKFGDQEWWLGLDREALVLEGAERGLDYHMDEHYRKGKSWEHCRMAWDNIVAPSVASRIACMGHSAGGSCIFSILQGDEAARERVKAVVFSDCYELEGDPAWRYDVLKPFMKSVGRGWYIGSANGALDTPIEWIANMYSCSDDLDFDCLSSGCDVHNLIPIAAIESMFNFVVTKLTQ